MVSDVLFRVLKIIFVGIGLLSGHVFAQETQATITLIFENVVKNRPMELYDATYTNSFGEDYTINKFRYYISNLLLENGREGSASDKTIYLIDQARKESQTISFSVTPGNYAALNFQIGVDSIFNVSGAQAGALDPTNDMFWTWNTGYVMAKLEGTSPASKVVNGKFEFHIGGFAGKNNVLKTVSLPFPGNGTLNFVAGKTTEIILVADADAWFRAPNGIRIADKPAINSPGKYAVAMSENYKKMFTIQKVTPRP